jgi:hypothetical protein
MPEVLESLFFPDSKELRDFPQVQRGPLQSFGDLLPDGTHHFISINEVYLVCSVYSVSSVA